MISIQLNHEDLNHIRFAYSLLMEVSMSFWVLYAPCDGTHFADWIEETWRASNYRICKQQFCSSISSRTS